MQSPPAESHARLEAEALEAIKGSIAPALKRLHQFMGETIFRPAGRRSPPRSFPDGAAYYQALIRLLTTTRPRTARFTRSGSMK